MAERTSAKSKSTKKASTVKTSKVNLDDTESNLDSLLSTNHFKKSLKKAETKIKKQDIEIDLDNDSQEEVIRKLVLTVKSLKSEIDELKIYVDGTFCTNAVHNRSVEELETKINILSESVDNI